MSNLIVKNLNIFDDDGAKFARFQLEGSNILLDRHLKGKKYKAYSKNIGIGFSIY